MGALKRTLLQQRGWTVSENGIKKVRWCCDVLHLPPPTPCFMSHLHLSRMSAQAAWYRRSRCCALWPQVPRRPTGVAVPKVTRIPSCVRDADSIFMCGTHASLPHFGQRSGLGPDA